MLGRVQAQARAIRGAVKPMADYASRASRLEPGVAEAASRAVNAVPGFMCAAAVAAIDDDIRMDLRELNAHLADTGELLGELADDWELADAGTADEFGQIAAGLNGIARPDES